MSNQSYQNILVGVDGSEQANEAFKKAVEVARRNQGKVYIAHVIDQHIPTMLGYAPLDTTLIEQEKDIAEDLLRECKEYAASVNFSAVEGVIAYGGARETMARELPEKYQIDLIMVGQSGLNAVERFITGSVASYIIREAKCDVLVVSSHEKNKDSDSSQD